MRVHQTYGVFPGGDPLSFTPDKESCTPQEIHNWAQACAAYGGAPLSPDCVNLGDVRVRFAGFGMGITRIPCDGYECGLCDFDEAVEYDPTIDA